MDKKRLVINIFASILGFAVNFCISFFLSPYIIESIGKEAYGFFNMGNQFVSYAAIASTAINSMASRFITIKIHQNDNEGRDRYFSSVIISNIILALVFLIPSVFIVLFLERLFSVPFEILTDVKILWALLFAGFIVNLIMNVYNVATFAVNKLYLNSVRNIESNLIRTVLLVSLFVFLKPSLWYLGLASLVCNLYVGIINVHYTKKFLPDVNVSPKNFKISCVKELLSSGIWNSFTQLAGVLNNGLDLLISNLFVSASAMGTLSISKLIPTYLSQFLALFAATFLPELTKNYAKDDKESLLNNIRFSRSIISTLSSTVVAVIIVYGDNFFKLWLPNENAASLHLVSIASIIMYVFIGSITTLGDVILLANKQKWVAITYFLAGILNLAIVFPSLQLIENDILIFGALEKETAKLLVISGVSAGIAIIRNLVFTPIYAAKCINVKWYSFYPLVIKNIFGTISVIIIGLLAKHMFPINSWIGFLISAILLGIVGLVINALFLFKKQQIEQLFNLISKKFKVKREENS